MLPKIKDAVFNFIWIFPMITNHREDRSVTALFIKLARAKHFKYIKPGLFGLGRLETEYGVVDFWDDNTYYAWAKPDYCIPRRVSITGMTSWQVGML